MTSNPINSNWFKLTQCIGLLQYLFLIWVDDFTRSMILSNGFFIWLIISNQWFHLANDSIQLISLNQFHPILWFCPIGDSFQSIISIQLMISNWFHLIHDIKSILSNWWYQIDSIQSNRLITSNLWFCVINSSKTQSYPIDLWTLFLMGKIAPHFLSTEDSPINTTWLIPIDPF